MEKEFKFFATLAWAQQMLRDHDVHTAAMYFAEAEEAIVFRMTVDQIRSAISLHFQRRSIYEIAALVSLPASRVNKFFFSQINLQERYRFYTEEGLI